jgi:antitoxin Phd
MKSIDEVEAQARLDEVLEEAQRQPIAITRQGQDTAVVVSIADYERLRRANIQGFLHLRKEVSDEASASGLTGERLTELLSDDDL